MELNSRKPYCPTIVGLYLAAFAVIYLTFLMPDSVAQSRPRQNVPARSTTAQQGSCAAAKRLTPPNPNNEQQVGQYLRALWKIGEGSKDENLANGICSATYLLTVQRAPEERLKAAGIPVAPDFAFVVGQHWLAVLNDALPRYSGETLSILRKEKQGLEEDLAAVRSNIVKCEPNRKNDYPSPGGWTPTATITNRAQLMTLTNVSIPLLFLDSSKRVVRKRTFLVPRLKPGETMKVDSTGDPIPNDLVFADVQMGDIRFDLE